MKIRNGFVSNSSSTSFLVFTSKNNLNFVIFDNYLEDEFEKKYIKETLGSFGMVYDHPDMLDYDDRHDYLLLKDMFNRTAKLKRKIREHMKNGGVVVKITYSNDGDLLSRCVYNGETDINLFFGGKIEEF